LEVLGAHDLNHVLAGYPTTAEGEVYVALFTAANSVDAGLDYLAAVLVQWHHDVKIGVFDPSRSDLQPDLLAEAVRRGATTATDLSGTDFAWRDLLHLPLSEARESIGVAGEGLVDAGGAWDALGQGDR
jgi:ubiquinone biosynthesis protein Coq4